MDLLIKVGTVAESQTTYQDGDIICGLSEVAIEFAHAQLICSLGSCPKNSDGLRPSQSLLHRYMAATSRYRFERVSTAEVVRVTLATGERETLSEAPNGAGEAIHVDEFVRRRVRHSRHKIFGLPGREIWYGGNAPRDRVTIDYVFEDCIEPHSEHRQENCKAWPFTETEKRKALPLNCCGHRDGIPVDVAAGTCAERSRGVYADDEQETMIAKKRWQVPYWDLADELNESGEDVRNPNKLSDPRSVGDRETWNHVDSVQVDKVATGIISL